jgi:membrane protein DedA with SNARE-associated domain
LIRRGTPRCVAGPSLIDTLTPPVGFGVGGPGLTETLIGQFGYFGIALILVLGGLGLPVPEEAPIIAAAVLSRLGKMSWPLALASCLVGVLLGDFVVYSLGFVYGEKVTSLRLTRKFLTKAREAQIQGYFHRHGFKILILGRFAVGFRTAAYLTAGILKLPPLKLFLTDLCAASLSTFLMFGLGYVFAYQIEQTLDRAKYLTAVAAVLIAAGLLYRYYKGRQRAGLPVGPKVLERLDLPLPPDDLHAYSGEFRPLATTRPSESRPADVLPMTFLGEGLSSGSGIRPSPSVKPTTSPPASPTRLEPDRPTVVDAPPTRLQPVAPPPPEPLPTEPRG